MGSHLNINVVKQTYCYHRFSNIPNASLNFTASDSKRLKVFCYHLVVVMKCSLGQKAHIKRRQLYFSAQYNVTLNFET